MYLRAGATHKSDNDSSSHTYVCGGFNLHHRHSKILFKIGTNLLIKTLMDKKVIDVCCGPKGMWFDKQDDRVLYMDIRKETHIMNHPSGNRTIEVSPDVIGDFTDIDQPDESFYIVVFDPPHIKRNKLGAITLRYGNLQDEWRDMIRDGFKECFRILKPNGTLIFKWSETQFAIKDILELTPYKPLFGHRSGKKMNTHWVAFIK